MLRKYLLLGRAFDFILVALVGLNTQVVSQPAGLEPFGSLISHDGSLPRPCSPGFPSREDHSPHGWGSASTSTSLLPDKVAVQPQEMLAPQTLPRSQTLADLGKLLPIFDQQRSLIAPQSAFVSETGPYQESNPLVLSTGTAHAESSRLSRIPLKQPDVPKQPKANRRSHALTQLQTTVEEWHDTMRRALGNPNLEFESLEDESRGGSRLFVAQDRAHEEDHHPFTTSLPSPSSNSDGKVHFVRSLAELRKIVPLKLENRNPRFFIYLNSQSNMNYLNKEYFLNRMHFFPIDPKHFQWEELNVLFKARKHFVGLPPRTEHGLPVLMARHVDGTDAITRIQKFTGAFEDQAQIVSLWSPVLHMKGRTTFVLYGVGQLNRGDIGPTYDYPNGRSDVDTLLHLSRLDREGKARGLSGDYYFKDHFPGDFMAKAKEVLKAR
ncbi:uncharacterized protein UTRI_10693 [Ustilago trichophora]|uniref:Effector family protein Eff1 n=1 Tax=Ustilago trichophora TaxID=86804 RepID=A0A5C3E8R1_9BASI|nr:uncharacterized protein UTRI_10693 [Ustilago trichophora]